MSPERSPKRGMAEFPLAARDCGSPLQPNCTWQHRAPLAETIEYFPGKLESRHYFDSFPEGANFLIPRLTSMF